MSDSPVGETLNLRWLIGLGAVAFSALYLISDLIELVQGGFSTAQLVLTYASEAAIPLFLIGLYAVQRPRIGSLGLVSALLYAYAYIFFTSTVVYALVARVDNWDILQEQIGVWITIHGVVAVFAGLGFGLAVFSAKVFPRWTGPALMASMILVAIASFLPAVAQITAAAVRDISFIGMGAYLVRSQPAPEMPGKAKT